MSAEGRRLSDLAELGRVVAARGETRAVLQHVLEVLQRHHPGASATIGLVEEGSGDVVVAASVGAAGDARQVRYRAGEGITGRVVQSGKPIVVPQVSREPLFLNRTRVFRKKKREELSFLCVPVPADGRVVGALGLVLPFEKERRYDEETQFLSVVAAMIGQAVRARQLVEAERQRLLQENMKLRAELRDRYELQNLVGSSRAMQQVYDQVAQVAPSTTTVLIRGESGTGKELVAHALHHGSPRADKPFVKVSCGALPEGLIESELFGHEAGAFTDARVAKEGRFERAHGGTLFLDEVGELSTVTQVKLLRVLQEREVERLGGTKAVKVDVRLVAATNKNLDLAVAAGAFREDLYYRLNVFSIFLPPLRDRKPDIPLLADHFVEKYAAALGRDVRRIATSAIDMLMSYHWPGNVRELENCMERAVLVCDGGVIHAHHLPPTLQTAEVSGTLPRRSLDSAVGAYEKDLIVDALKSARGNRARAARLLDTTERIIGYKVKKYGIDPERFS